MRKVDRFGWAMGGLLALSACAAAPESLDEVVPSSAALAAAAAGSGSGASAGVSDSNSLADGYSAYVALGDSFATANGIANEGPPCYKGKGAWPYLLWASLPKLSANAPVVDEACSGATTAAILNSEQGQPPQIDKVKALTKEQLSSALVTITIGGNDIGVAAELLDCVGLGTSCANAEHEASITSKIDAVRGRLLTVYKALRAAAPTATIVAVGYPKLVLGSETAKCSDGVNFDLDPQERAMIRGRVQYMNSQIAAAADDATINSITAEVEQRFETHELCSLTAPAEPFFHFMDEKVSAEGWFHPNAAGIKAYSEAVLQGLSKVVKKIGTVEQTPTTPSEPTLPGGEYPSEPSEPSEPSDPSGEYPSEPSEPGDEYPSDPSGEYPSEPSEPGDEYPSEPSEPGDEYPSEPSEPGDEYPSEPGDEYPSEPSDEYPSEPSESGDEYPGGDDSEYPYNDSRGV